MTIHKAKIVFTITGIVFFAGLFFFSGIWGFVTGKKMYWHKELQQVDAWESRKTVLRQSIQSQKEWEEIASEFKTFKKERFLPKIDFYTFRMNLESLITSNQLSKLSLVFDTKEKTLIDTEKVRFRVNVSGDYPRIKRFIDELERLPWMVLIDKTNLKLDNGRVNAFFDLEVHFAI